MAVVVLMSLIETEVVPELKSPPVICIQVLFTTNEELGETVYDPVLFLAHVNVKPVLFDITVATGALVPD